MSQNESNYLRIKICTAQIILNGCGPHIDDGFKALLLKVLESSDDGETVMEALTEFRNSKYYYKNKEE